VVFVVAGLVAGFYFLLYPVKRYPMPIGWDTPRYLLQTNIVAAKGLTGVPPLLPPPSKTLASRAAFPVIVLSLSSLFSASTFKLAETLPVAATVAAALASAALASAALRRKAWEFAVIAFLVGLSPFLIRLMAPETYTDNLSFTALTVAAFVPMMFVARDGRGFLATIALLSAAALAHAPFFGAAAAVVALVGLALLPASRIAWRAGTRPLATATGRVATILGGTGLVAGGVMFGLLRQAPDTPKLSPGELSKKLREDVPLYVFPVTAPLSAVGATAVAVTAGRTPGRLWRALGLEGADPFGARFLLTVMAAWTAVVLAGLAAFSLGRDVPAHRFVAMLIPVALLGAVGVLALSRWVRSMGSNRRFGRLAATAVVAVAVAGVAVLGIRELYVTLPTERGVEWIEYHKVEETANAVAYLDSERVPADTPVVFVVDDGGNNPLSNIPELAYITRAALPADRVLHSWFYVGNPENYLAGRPTHRVRPQTYDANSDAFWRPLTAMLRRRAAPPVALLLKSLTPFYGTMLAKHPDWEAAPGVIVLSGPRPPRPLGAGVAPYGMRTVPQGVVLSLGTLIVLALIGLGWAVALLPPGLRSFEVLALALAFGIGFLLFSGILLDAVGIRLAGWGGTGAVLLAGISGWAAAVFRGSRMDGLPFEPS
jgi:hypothetical protein